MHKEDIKISVVDVVVDSKLPYFKKSFESLLKQDYTDFEFIIVIGYPGTNTLQFLSEHQDTPFRVIPILEPERDKSELPARPSAQNMGINAASGNVILTTQDDIIFPENWVSSHIKWHATHKPPIAVFNKVLGAFTEEDTSTESDMWDRLANPAITPIRGRWRYGSGHSFSYTATDDVRVPESYNGRWGFEDIDLSYQLHKLGYWIYFDADIIVMHQPHGDDVWSRREKGKESFLRWLRDRSVNRRLFAERNGFCPEYGTPYNESDFNFAH